MCRVLNYNNSQLQLLCNLSVLSLLKDVTKSHDHIYLCANKNEVVSTRIYYIYYYNCYYNIFNKNTDIFQLPSLRPTAGDGRYCQLKGELTIGNAVQMIKSHLGVDNLMIAMARGSTLGKFENFYTIYIILQKKILFLRFFFF